MHVEPLYWELCGIAQIYCIPGTGSEDACPLLVECAVRRPSVYCLVTSIAWSLHRSLLMVYRLMCLMLLSVPDSVTCTKIGVHIVGSDDTHQ